MVIVEVGEGTPQPETPEKHDHIIWFQRAVGTRVMFSYRLFLQSWTKSSNILYSFKLALINQVCCLNVPASLFIC